jgi:inner membrane protein
MRFYTHIASGILFYVIFAYLINLNIAIFGIFVVGMISVFPDLVDKLNFKHRTIGHSLIWLIPFVIIGFLNFGVGFALLIGFLSHIFMDIMTWNGCPLLYPFSKVNFVALNKRNRVKTGTAKERAIFIFILFMLVPTILFSTGIVSVSNNSGLHNTIFATGEASGVPLNNHNREDITNEHINLNFQINSNTNKNITVLKDSDNETSFIIKDL